MPNTKKRGGTRRIDAELLRRHSKLLGRFGREDDETFFMLRHLPEMIEQFARMPPVEVKKGRRRKSEAEPVSDAESEMKKTYLELEEE